MTEKDIANLLAINHATYPYAYKDTSIMDKKALVKIWLSLFEKYDAEYILFSFQSALKVCKMPVTPADIFTQLKKLEEATSVTSDELFNSFSDSAYKANLLSNAFNYTMLDINDKTQGLNAREQVRDMFNELPKEIKTFCGDMYRLIDYGKMGSKELTQFIKPDFMRRITSLKERAKTLEETPDEIMKLSSGTAKALSMRNVLKIDGGTDKVNTAVETDHNNKKRIIIEKVEE